MQSIEQLIAELTLGQYKGLVCPKAVITVSDDEVNSAVDLEKQSHKDKVVVERQAKEGDVAVIDYRGTVDDVAFEGGTSENYSLVLGSHTFIAGFEEQVIGHCAGEEIDVYVTFPTPYHAENLAGKPAVFHVKIREVCEQIVPELTDDYAKKFYQLESLEAYKEAVKERIYAEKEHSAKYSRQQGLLETVVKSTPFALSDELIQSRIDDLFKQYEERLSMQGLTMEQYYQFTGATAEILKENLMPQAVKEIQNTVILEAIVRKEGIEISEEELDKQYTAMAASYSMDKAQLLSLVTEEIKASICADLKLQKAIELIDAYSVEE